MTVAVAPRVSVIMNCLNGEAYLREALDSVFAQTFDDWEVVFFDNVSTDASAATARSYGEKLRYYCGEQTIPLGAARNAAIALARGELITFLDTDDRWRPDKLAQQVAAMDADAAVGFVYTNFHFLDGGSGAMHPGYRTPQPDGNVFRAFLRHYPVNLQTVMVRRAALAAFDGPFDPAFDVSEEYDLFLRLLHDVKARYLAAPTAIYRVHGNMASIRHIDKYPVENERILAKLRAAIPDLDRSYPEEIAYLEAKLGYWYACAHMQKGDRAAAQRALAPFKRSGAMFFGLYVATFFPVAVWQWLQRLRLRLRPA